MEECCAVRTGNALHALCTADPIYEDAKWWMSHPTHHPGRVTSKLPRRVLRVESGKVEAGESIDLVSETDPELQNIADCFYVHGTQAVKRLAFLTTLLTLYSAGIFVQRQHSI